MPLKKENEGSNKAIALLKKFRLRRFDRGTFSDVTPSIVAALQKEEVWPASSANNNNDSEHMDREYHRSARAGHIFLSSKSAVGGEGHTETFLFSGCGDINNQRWIRLLVAILKDEDYAERSAANDNDSGNNQNKTLDDDHDKHNTSGASPAVTFVVEIHNVLRYQPAQYYASTDKQEGVESATRQGDDASAIIAQYHAAIKDRELRLLKELVVLLEALLARQKGNHNDSGDALVVVVPVYRVLVDAADTGATRLAEICDVSHQLLVSCVDPEQSVLAGSTALLMALQSLLVSNNEQATDDNDGDTQRGIRVAALECMLAFATECIENDGEDVCLGTERCKQFQTRMTDVVNAHRHGDDDVNNKAEQYALTAALRMPSALVHCMQGVSRSPSIVLLFYMEYFRHSLRKIYEKYAHTENANVCDSHTFFLSAMQRARPIVCPNVCFSSQMLVMWRQSICSSE